MTLPDRLGWKRFRRPMPRSCGRRRGATWPPFARILPRNTRGARPARKSVPARPTRRPRAVHVRPRIPHFQATWQTLRESANPVRLRSRIPKSADPTCAGARISRFQARMERIRVPGSRNGSKRRYRCYRRQVRYHCRYKRRGTTQQVRIRGTAGGGNGNAKCFSHSGTVRGTLSL